MRVKQLELVPRRTRWGRHLPYRERPGWLMERNEVHSSCEFDAP